MKNFLFVMGMIVMSAVLVSGCHHRYHGPKPFMCKVIVTYEGKDVIGRDEGKNLEKAKKEAIEEACERACDGTSCERDCQDTSVLKAYACRDRSTGDHFGEGDVFK